MRTEEWARMPLEIREAAFFSAGVTELRTLVDMQDIIDEALNLNPAAAFADRSRFVRDMRKNLGAAPGDSGKLTDLTSRRRLELIYDFQMEDAYAQGRLKAHQTPELLAAFPAQELIRMEGRKERRNWRARWAANGGQLYGANRMIALINDPIWSAISHFGKPTPPFDFGSGMGVASVSRREALRLGVIAQGDAPPAPAKGTSFNADRQASIKGLPDSALDKLSDVLGASVKFKGGKAQLSAVNTGDLYQRARDGEVFKSTAYEVVSPQVAAAIAKVTNGQDLSRYRHGLDSSSIIHTHNNHGDSKIESARGQIAITKTDFERLPRLMRNVTEVRLGDKSKFGLERLEFICRDPDSPSDYVVIEEVRSPKGKFLTHVSMWRHKGRAPSALENQPFGLTSETIPTKE